MSSSTPSNSSTPAVPAAATPAPPATGVARTMGTEVERYGDVGGQRAGAEARALVEARFVMARRFPRDLDDVRARIMREVERPGFAAIAWYKKPVGAGVEGLSVRFYEAAARCMGNIMVVPTTTYEDERKRVVHVEVIDLETNYSPALDVTVEKTVERSSVGDRTALSVRMNSNNKPTYLVLATEDELLGKANAQVSKARRNLLAQVVPGDICDAAKVRILEIRRGDAAADPDGVRTKVVDGFNMLNVPPSELKRYLGHELTNASPAELTDLRDLYNAIKEGEAVWAVVLAERLEARGEAAAAAGAAGAEPPKPGLAGVTDRLKAAGAGASSTSSSSSSSSSSSAPGAAAGPSSSTTSSPATCRHELAQGHLADQPVGSKARCPQCGAEVVRERQPGEDDEEAPPAADKGKPRQGRL